MRKQRTRPGDIGVRTLVEGARLVGKLAGDQPPETREALQAYETGQPAQGWIGPRLMCCQIEDLCAIFGDDRHLSMGDGGNGNTDVRPFMRRRMMRRNRRRGGEHRDGGDEAVSPDAKACRPAPLPHRSSLSETSAASVQRP